MTEEPTVDEFQRYLQEKLVVAEQISDKSERIRVSNSIECGLFEAINFLREVKTRKQVIEHVFEESSSVRLLSSSDNVNPFDDKLSEICPKCDEALTGDLNFCQVCGYKKK